MQWENSLFRSESLELKIIYLPELWNALGFELLLSNPNPLCRSLDSSDIIRRLSPFIFSPARFLCFWNLTCVRIGSENSLSHYPSFHYCFLCSGRIPSEFFLCFSFRFKLFTSRVALSCDLHLGSGVDKIILLAFASSLLLPRQRQSFTLHDELKSLLNLMSKQRIESFEFSADARKTRERANLIFHERLFDFLSL